MKLLLLAAPILSFLVLGAHFLRESAWWLVAVCALLIALLAWRRPWVPRVVQVALALGTIEWLWTAAMLIQERMVEGRPWLRLAAILGAVAVFTAASAWAVQRLRGWYGRN